VRFHRWLFTLCAVSQQAMLQWRTMQILQVVTLTFSSYQLHIAFRGCYKRLHYIMFCHVKIIVILHFRIPGCKYHYGAGLRQVLHQHGSQFNLRVLLRTFPNCGQVVPNSFNWFNLMSFLEIHLKPMPWIESFMQRLKSRLLWAVFNWALKENWWVPLGFSSLRSVTS